LIISNKFFWLTHKFPNAFLFVLTSNVIAIGSCTGSTAENVGGQVVDLLTVLVSNNGATSGSGIGSKYHAILKKTKGKYFWLIELMQGNQGVLIN
jgi:hypothetical protein